MEPVMAASEHHYEVCVTWTGNDGDGTTAYRGYRRDHLLEAVGPLPIPGSADPQFLGEGARWNPEQLLVAALSACHKLWYLHLCAGAGLVVESYVDWAVGTLRLDGDGKGRFVDVCLRPEVTLRAPADTERALALHVDAHARCFIANSVTCPVRREPRIEIAAPE
jgi:organic hydroperoxide reductase OsmC/OhrA